jgi:hypothetical protein
METPLSVPDQPVAQNADTQNDKPISRTNDNSDRRRRVDESTLSDGFKRTDHANLRWKHTVSMEEKVIWHHVMAHWRMVTFGWNGEDTPRDEQGKKISRVLLPRRKWGEKPEVTATIESQQVHEPQLSDGFKRTDIANIKWKWTVEQEEKVICHHIIRSWMSTTFGQNKTSAMSTNPAKNMADQPPDSV